MPPVPPKIVLIVAACVLEPEAGLISVPLKLSPCTVTPEGILKGKISLYTPFLT